MMFGAIGADGDLGIAEGAENALSATILFRVPCWAAGNAELLKQFPLIDGVRRLHIFADNDEARRGKGKDDNVGLAAASARLE